MNESDTNGMRGRRLGPPYEWEIKAKARKRIVNRVTLALLILGAVAVFIFFAR